MLRKIAYAGILGLIALTIGCTMCCHPYDYNGPVYDAYGQCASNIRAGSILDSGDMEPLSESPDQSLVEETSSDIEHNSPKVAEYEGATQILSVTDRKVEETETLTPPLPEADPPKATIAQPNSSKLRWH